MSIQEDIKEVTIANIDEILQPKFEKDSNLLESAKAAILMIKDSPDLAPAKIKNLEVWCKKLIGGYQHRPSRRLCRSSDTVQDPIVKDIITIGLGNVNTIDVEMVVCSHRIAMASENILGDILEEYISTKIENTPWHIAWGATLKSVDCYNQKERKLLQLKNRSNSENSSSKKVRDGRNIQRWYRIDAKSGNCMWDSLEEIMGAKKNTFSEKDFKLFVKRLISSNTSFITKEFNDLRAYFEERKKAIL